MNNRLEQFLAAENISQAEFADAIGVARASVSHILAGRNKPSYDFLTGMLLHYPRLNMEWLLAGKGKMYKEPLESRIPPAPAAEPEPAPEPEPQAVNTQTYVLNTNTHKFHYPHCSSVRDMAERNKQFIDANRDDIIASGYQPCQRRNP